MNFVNLSALQSWTLVLATIVLVCFLFFLRLRHRHVVVGSALLWNRILDAQHTHALRERLRRLLSLLLTLLIATLIALAIGGPTTDATGTSPGTIVVVMDTSPSMETRQGSGTTRWSMATTIARQILESGPSFRPRMIADTIGRIHSLPDRNKQRALEALGQMRPLAGTQTFPGLPTRDGDVFFITDGVTPIDLPEGVTELSVFEPALNVALTAFEVRADPTSESGYRAFVEIRNDSSDPVEVDVLLSGAGGQRQAWSLALAAGNFWQNDLDLTGFQGGGLRIRIEAAGDALELDDTAYAWLPPTHSTRVVLVTAETGGYLETLLSLSPQVDLSIVRPLAFIPDATTDVYVFDGFAPEVAPDKPSIVFGGADVDWLPRVTQHATDQTITSWNADHPIMRRVPVSDISVFESAIFDTRDWTVMAASDTTPLIVANASTPRTVFIGFQLNDSDFAFHLGFPILMENVLTWFSGDGLADLAGLGQITFPADVDSVTMLDGTTVPTRRHLGETIIEAPEPNLFTAVLEGRRIRIAANLSENSAPNVNQTRLTDLTPRAFSPTEAGGVLWPYMLVAAICLIVLEWWTFHKRFTL